ncbi:MAG TPA: hypothetical protein VM100_03865, partial [Longimicrobiales bacterium]|nr:hypothetical protein [Longimicrobiales bacterium]
NRMLADQAVERYLREVSHLTNANSVGRYHGALDSVFGSQRIADAARTIMFDELILPYDRLLGQQKQRSVFEFFAARASTAFEKGNPGERAVFNAWLDIIADAHDSLLAQWEDSRMVFLPLQLVLRPEQHDTQAELDALVARAVRNDFSEGNFVSYAVNEQYQYQLSRTIREAKDYHVLWTHDVRGLDDQKQPDEMAFRQVLHSYMRAMIERVRAYDRDGKMPVYILLLDQWFYEINRGRIWVSLLEDPLNYHVKLPKAYAAWEDSISQAQAQLRKAVNASTRLQADRAHLGDKWLKNVVRVQVYITNPPDATFWSRNVIHYVPLPDNMARDHRKLAFYDITEDDPYRGGALFTGAGVAEHYASLSWEDRTLVVRGPALLSLKKAARDLLLQQGMSESEIPVSLRAQSVPARYNEMIVHEPQNDQPALRALTIQNGIGFANKDVNVAKAILYTLMPPGSVIKIPDSLWDSMFWGGALCGAALRGVRVLIIAPAERNSPVPKTAPLSRGEEMLSRILTARQILAHHIASTGGQLRIGLYSPSFEVTNIPAKLQAVQETFEKNVWLRDLFGFPASVYKDLADLSNASRNLSMKSSSPAREFEYDPIPKLHLKANFLASAEAWKLMTRPEWGAFSWEYVQQRIAQVQTRRAAVGSFEDIAEPFIDVGGPVVKDWLSKLPADERARVMFYTVMGSQNQNYRSMVVDGEIGFVVSGWPSVIPYLDLISLIGQSKWVDTQEELHALLPPHDTRAWRMARWLKLTT